VFIVSVFVESNSHPALFYIKYSACPPCRWTTPS